MKGMKLELKFEPRDIWVGLFWTIKSPTLEMVHFHDTRAKWLLLYFCLIPMVVIIITIPNKHAYGKATS